MSGHAIAWVSGAVAFVTAWAVVGGVRRYALRASILDIPGERSSHTAPTPRGGGIGLLAGVFVGLVLAATIGTPMYVGGWIGLAGVLMVAAIGWQDDRVGLGVAVRLAFHIIGALSLLPLAAQPSALPAWMGSLSVAWWVFWGVAAVNVVNFMDGIDGLIGGAGLVYGLHLVTIGGFGSMPSMFGMVLAAASAGFLAWNWPPAKIFLGDVGSGALGLLLVLGGALTMRETGAGLIAVFLPLYPLFLDATVTLLRRVARGDRPWEAHREHLYQRLANGGWGHRRVSVLYMSAAVAGLLVSLAHRMPWWWSLVAAYAAAVLALGGWLDRRVASVGTPWRGST